MSSATARPAPSELLHHLPIYQVLICRECRYAIQPAAISRHLKDLHHIYRSNRRELVEYAKRLQLVDPKDVVLPRPSESPVPILPIENGFACARESCTHLCVSVKRMKSHWATSHKNVVVEEGCSQWQPVALQTFFRGNQLRYFVVSLQSSPGPSSAQSSEKQSVPDTRISKAMPPFDCSDSYPLASEPIFPPDWTSDDIALFKHFTEFTYHDMGQSPMSRRMWQVSIPEMALRYDFLKHGILACSALHLAHLKPSERQRFQIVGACHQERALPQFRALLADPTGKTCNAMLAFSHLLIVHYFAAGEQDDTLLLLKEDEEAGLPDWLRVIRGSCTIYRHFWSYMKTGPMKPLIDESLSDQPTTIIPENPEYSARLKQLLTLPVFGEATSEQMTTYFSALMLLSRAFGCAQRAMEKGTFTLWTVVQVWPSRVSLEYLGLLRAGEPAALVLLAHYCILLGPLEESWYMIGFRKRLFDRIYWQLDEEWRKRLEWPFAEAGLQLPPERARDI